MKLKRYTRLLGDDLYAKLQGEGLEVLMIQEWLNRIYLLLCIWYDTMKMIKREEGR